MENTKWSHLNSLDNLNDLKTLYRLRYDKEFERIQFLQNKNYEQDKITKNNEILLNEIGIIDKLITMIENKKGITTSSAEKRSIKRIKEMPKPKYIHHFSVEDESSKKDYERIFGNNYNFKKNANFDYVDVQISNKKQILDLKEGWGKILKEKNSSIPLNRHHFENDDEHKIDKQLSSFVNHNLIKATVTIEPIPKVEPFQRQKNVPKQSKVYPSPPILPPLNISIIENAQNDVLLKSKGLPKNEMRAFSKNIYSSTMTFIEMTNASIKRIFDSLILADANVDLMKKLASKLNILIQPLKSRNTNIFSEEATMYHILFEKIMNEIDTHLADIVSELEKRKKIKVKSQLDPLAGLSHEDVMALLLWEKFKINVEGEIPLKYWEEFFSEEKKKSDSSIDPFFFKHQELYLKKSMLENEQILKSFLDHCLENETIQLESAEYVTNIWNSFSSLIIKKLNLTQEEENLLFGDDSEFTLSYFDKIKSNMSSSSSNISSKIPNIGVPFGSKTTFVFMILAAIFSFLAYYIMQAYYGVDKVANKSVASKLILKQFTPAKIENTRSMIQLIRIVDESSKELKLPERIFDGYQFNFENLSTVGDKYVKFLNENLQSWAQEQEKLICKDLSLDYQKYSKIKIKFQKRIEKYVEIKLTEEEKELFEAVQNVLEIEKNKIALDVQNAMTKFDTSKSVVSKIESPLEIERLEESFKQSLILINVYRKLIYDFYGIEGEFAEGLSQVFLGEISNYNMASFKKFWQNNLLLDVFVKDSPPEVLKKIQKNIYTESKIDIFKLKDNTIITAKDVINLVPNNKIFTTNEKLAETLQKVNNYEYPLDLDKETMTKLNIFSEDTPEVVIYKLKINKLNEYQKQFLTNENINIFQLNPNTYIDEDHAIQLSTTSSLLNYNHLLKHSVSMSKTDMKTIISSIGGVSDSFQNTSLRTILVNIEKDILEEETEKEDFLERYDKLLKERELDAKEQNKNIGILGSSIKQFQKIMSDTLVLGSIKEGFKEKAKEIEENIANLKPKCMDLIIQNYYENNIKKSSLLYYLNYMNPHSYSWASNYENGWGFVPFVFLELFNQLFTPYNILKNITVSFLGVYENITDVFFNRSSPLNQTTEYLNFLCILFSGLYAIAIIEREKKLTETLLNFLNPRDKSVMEENASANLVDKETYTKIITEGQPKTTSDVMKSIISYWPEKLLNFKKYLSDSEYFKSKTGISTPIGIMQTLILVYVMTQFIRVIAVATGFIKVPVYDFNPSFQWDWNWSREAFTTNLDQLWQSLKSPLGGIANTIYSIVQVGVTTAGVYGFYKTLQWLKFEEKTSISVCDTHNNSCVTEEIEKYVYDWLFTRGKIDSERNIVNKIDVENAIKKTVWMRRINHIVYPIRLAFNLPKYLIERYYEGNMSLEGNVGLAISSEFWDYFITSSILNYVGSTIKIKTTSKERYYNRTDLFSSTALIHYRSPKDYDYCTDFMTQIDSYEKNSTDISENTNFQRLYSAISKTTEAVTLLEKIEVNSTGRIKNVRNTIDDILVKYQSGNVDQPYFLRESTKESMLLPKSQIILNLSNVSYVLDNIKKTLSLPATENSVSESSTPKK